VDGRAYLADGFALPIIDVHNPANPVLLGSNSLPSFITAVDVVGNLAYVCGEYAGFCIYDVSNPGAIVLKGKVPLTYADAVYVTNNLAFVSVTSSYGDNKLVIFDVSHPNNPVELSRIQSGSAFSEVQMVDQTIYVAEGAMGLGVLSFSQVAPQAILNPLSQIVSAEQLVTFTGSGTGTAPLNFQWRKNGVPIPGATQSAYIIPHATIQDSGSYDFVLSNVKGFVISSNATLSVSNSTVLTSEDYRNAVGASGLNWSSYGDRLWILTSNTTHSGALAAQSGAISEDESSFLRSMITGPGVLSFWWKVSSEKDYDHLAFAIDGVGQASISGEVDWQQRSFRIPTGLHTAQWSYSKDYSVDRGVDAGWLDDVTFATNSFPVVLRDPVSVATVFGNATIFSVKASGDNLAYQWRIGNNEIIGATNSMLIISSVQPAHVGRYQVVITNSFGSAISAPASLTILSTNLPKLSAMQIDGSNLSVTVTPLPQTGTLVIESSTNLLDWSALQTNIINSATFQITLPIRRDKSEFLRLLLR
jgi:hypothetical protein